jgi:hypothetical protein
MNKLVPGRTKRWHLAMAFLLAVGAAGCGSSTARQGSTIGASGTLATRLPPVPELGHGDKQALSYITRADLSALRARADCLRRPQGDQRLVIAADSGVTAAQGSPSAAILSSFAVFKLPARTSVPRGDIPSPVKAFFSYARVAQRRYGWPFKIVPVVIATRIAAHCVALEGAAARASVAHAPAKVRAKVLQLEHDLQLDWNYNEQHPDGVCVVGYHGGSFCEPLLAALALGGLGGSGSSASNGVNYYLAPNGVAAITVRYPDQNGSPSRTITVPVINNLAVWKVNSETVGIGPTIQWRAGDGRITRTVYRAL